MRNKLSILIYILLVLVCTFIFVSVNKNHQEKIDDLTHNKYLATSQNITNYVEQSLIQKKQKGLTLALSLANNKQYIDFFKDNSIKIELKSLVNSLKEHTNQHNVWIHFVSKEGISLYRSWVEKKGDNVAVIRKELPSLLSDPKPINLISVGIFDLAFKSIVPVYDEGKFLGLIEVVTKINSITDNLKDIGYDPVVLVDKKYKNQLKKPFTKKFVNDYYVANLNASKDNLDFLDNNTEKFLQNKEYVINEDKLIVTYKIKDIFNEDMAYILIFEDLKSINIKDITSFDRFVKATGVFIILILLLILISVYFYNRSKYTEKLEESVNERTKEILELKDYHKALFDKNPNIVFVAANNYGILETNSSFFRFFSNYDNIEEFNAQNDCLCKFAILVDDETYINPTKEWNKQILKPNMKLCLKKDEKKYHFRLEAQTLEHKHHKEVYLVTLTDITELITTQKELEEKKELIYQQSKLADMGQMIGNIAHQWRQPLSVISTAATAIQLKNEHGILDDKYLNETLDEIENSAQYLSKTIDTFRDFLKEDKVLKEVILQERIDKAIQIVGTALKNNYIEIINNIRKVEPIKIKLIAGELSQVIINILNNSKDAIKERNIKNPWVKIELEKFDDKVIIFIEDNGGGIPENIIDKIFEPYFTTKHEMQGTGLGLHMSRKIITESLKGKLYVKNTQSGAKFFIELPLQS